MSNNPDRLYELLPMIYRMRDAEQGYPLRALFQVIAEQVDVVEDDIAQLYENWFIETAQDWAVPYVGDLIGYRQVHEAGEPGEGRTARGLARNKILIPRREIANTIGYRRRKGTLALLELLANDVAGWPTRVVEFARLLGWTQSLNYPHPRRGRTVDIHFGDALDRLDGPFDQIAHTVDARRSAARPARGRYNIPSVGVFVWRLKAYSVTRTPAYCLEEIGPHCYTFSVLGNDTPLYVRAEPEREPTHIATELNLPVPIRRHPFDAHKTDYYGAGKSIEIWVSDWAGYESGKPLPAGAIIPADLSKWRYRPPRGHIAVDPALGRMVFPPSQLPKKNVRVSYMYAFSADIGGGEYDRPIEEPAGAVLYRVERPEQLKEVLAPWQDQRLLDSQPPRAVIELAGSGAYVPQINITLKADHSLQIRAANRTRPVIRLIDWQTDMPDSFNVTMAPGSHFTLDGLLITGRAVNIRGAEGQDTAAATCPAEVHIRHCTLVPGWGLNNNCEPRRPTEPSLELFNVRARLTVEHSILGSIQINQNQVRTDPIPISITDSILDATSGEREALGAPGWPVAHAVLTIARTTVFGIVQVHAIELAENCIFNDCLNVARRQLGCMRFCYVPPGCRTPRRYNCQPDLVEQVVKAKIGDPTDRSAAQARERERVRPQFNSVRYGRPDYCQLADTCADEIKRGADDEAEMGVFHDLFQPQREANLRARLDEYTPVGADTGIIFAS
jgi:hypothetical protein